MLVFIEAAKPSVLATRLPAPSRYPDGSPTSVRKVQ